MLDLVGYVCYNHIYLFRSLFFCGKILFLRAAKHCICAPRLHFSCMACGRIHRLTREALLPVKFTVTGKIFRNSGGAVMRVKITLACSECKQRNYNTAKNKKNDPDRLEMNKFCPFCKKHTLHKETK